MLWMKTEKFTRETHGCPLIARTLSCSRSSVRSVPPGKSNIICQAAMSSGPIRPGQSCGVSANWKSTPLLSVCSVNSYSTLHTFSALAPVSSLMVDHITKRRGPESYPRNQVESSYAVHTLTDFGRHSVWHGSGAGGLGVLVKSG